MFELSFSPEFFGDVYEPGKWEKGRPVSLVQAVLDTHQKKPEHFKKMLKDVFEIDCPEVVEEDLLSDIIERAIEYNTCSFRGSLAVVYISDHYSFDVFEG